MSSFPRQDEALHNLACCLVPDRQRGLWQSVLVGAKRGAAGLRVGGVHLCLSSIGSGPRYRVFITGLRSVLRSMARAPQPRCGLGSGQTEGGKLAAVEYSACLPDHGPANQD